MESGSCAMVHESFLLVSQDKASKVAAIVDLGSGELARRQVS